MVSRRGKRVTSGLPRRRGRSRPCQRPSALRCHTDEYGGPIDDAAQRRSPST